MKKFQMGFTLFELLVVISIIGILVGLGTVAFSSAQKRARDARRKQDMDAVQNALEQCYGELNGSYPSPGWTTGSLVCGGITIMNSFPTDPKGSGGYTYTSCQSGTCDADGYCYCANLESADGNHGASDCSSPGGTGYYCVSQRQ